MDSAPANTSLDSAASADPTPEPAGTTLSVAAAIAVPVRVIAGQEGLPFALYRRDGDDFRPYRPAQQTLSLEDASALVAQGVNVLYICGTDYGRYCRNVQSRLCDVLLDPGLGEERFAVGYSALAQAAEDLLHSPGEENIRRVAQLGGQLAAAAARDGDAVLLPLHRVRQPGYSTDSHMVNVSVLLLMMARAMEIHADEWAPLAAAGLLHDVGMTGIPEAVLEKEGRLVRNEWPMIHDHPFRGAALLRQLADLDPRCVEMAIMHHEQLDGQGYPSRLTSDQISQWGRMCSLVDMFDRLTTARPFREPVNAFRAATLIRNDIRGRFDPELADRWHRVVSAWPDPAAASDVQADPSGVLVTSSGKKVPALDRYLVLPPLSVPDEQAERAHHRRKPNKRAFPRFNFRTTCQIRYVRAGADPDAHIGFWAITLDLSRSGIQFIHDAPMRMGEVVSIYVPGPNNGRHLEAMIVRCQRLHDGSYTIGARFDYQQ